LAWHEIFGVRSQVAELLGMEILVLVRLWRVLLVLLTHLSLLHVEHLVVLELSLIHEHILGLCVLTNKSAVHLAVFWNLLLNLVKSVHLRGHATAENALVVERLVYQVEGALLGDEGG